VTIRVPQDKSSIQAAVTSATAGDTVLISDGTYNEHGIVLTHSLTLASVNGNAATTVNGQNLGGIFQINLPITDKVTIRGLTITGGTGTGSWATVRRIAGMLEVRDCIFTQNYANGGVIDARGHVDTSVIEPDKTLVIDCIFNNNSAENFAGIAGATAVNCLLYNNTGWNNPVALASCNSTNCTVYGNTGGVLGNPWTTGGMSGGTAVNCIFWGNSGYNGQQVDQTTPATITYGIVQGGYAGTGNLTSDPLFVNAANGDFHLKSGSPAINTGDPAILKPDGTRSDIGYTYYQASPQSFLTNGLVAYYPFNGNANDASGNGHNGTNHGALLTANRFGETNKAYLFNSGSLSFIDVALLRPAIEGLSQATFSIWFAESHSQNEAVLFADWGNNYGAIDQNLGIVIQLHNGKLNFSNNGGYGGLDTFVCRQHGIVAPSRRSL
jgi:hypothetical protein